MTVAALIKILEKCNSRAEVCVYVDSFEKPIEEHNTLPVESATCERIDLSDGDGFYDLRKDGQPKSKLMVILRGNKELNEEFV